MSYWKAILIILQHVKAGKQKAHVLIFLVNCGKFEIAISAFQKSQFPIPFMDWG